MQQTHVIEPLGHHGNVRRFSLPIGLHPRLAQKLTARGKIFFDAIVFAMRQARWWEKERDMGGWPW
jgi:hypothetical protein